MTTGEATPGPDLPKPDLLRAEHDSLAQKLVVRRSIDFVRRGLYAGFAGFVASGLAIKFAYDFWFSTRVTRFKGPPVFFYSALAAALILIAISLWAFLRARRLMREEDRLFAAFRELRERLRIEP